MNETAVSGGAALGSPSPAGPWHFSQVRLKSCAPAWIAVGFPASGLALTRGLAWLATGLITPGDCWATNSSVALNTTDATTTAVEKGFDMRPREFVEGTIAL